MAFDNQIGRGKDRRKPYRDSRRFDWSCRHGGNCGYCSNNRQFANKRRAPIEHPVIEDGFSGRIKDGRVIPYRIYNYALLAQSGRAAPL